MNSITELFSITELIYEPIVCNQKNGHTFGRAKYGEFEIIVMENGYINATKLCEQGGKDMFHWIRNAKAKEIINYFEEMISKPGTAKILIKGGSNPEVTGTYMPHKIIVHVASWVSVKFAFMVSDIVEEYLVREYRESIREKNTTIDELNRKIDQLLKDNKTIIADNKIAYAKLDDTHNELLDNKEILLGMEEDLVETKAEVEYVTLEVSKVSEKLGISSDQRVPPLNDSNIEHLVVIRLVTPTSRSNIFYTYQVIRRKQITLKREIAKFPGEIIIDLECVPNSTILFNIMKMKLTKLNKKKNKKNIRRSKTFEVNYNSINLLVSEELFINRVKRVYNKRLLVKID
jgi:hypothetical protein